MVWNRVDYGVHPAMPGKSILLGDGMLKQLNAHNGGFSMSSSISINQSAKAGVSNQNQKEKSMKNNHTQQQFEIMWRNKWLTSEAKSILAMAKALEAAAKRLRKMGAAGIRLDLANSTMGDAFAFLTASDPKGAKPFWLAEMEREH